MNVYLIKKSTNLCWGASAMRRFQKQQTTSTQVRIIRTIGSQEEASNIMDFFFLFKLFILSAVFVKFISMSLLWLADNMVGQGGYSEVYRGHLDNGQIVAVKRLAKDNADENKEKEFLIELGIIGHVCHPNTANLVGCCIENGLHLIFNFSPNGTLSSALHGKEDFIH